MRYRRVQSFRRVLVVGFPCVLPTPQVVQVELHDFDVVYSPYISSYGSCTATLEHSLGTAVSIFITYLTERLLQRMHATEGGAWALRHSATYTLSCACTRNP